MEKPGNRHMSRPPYANSQQPELLSPNRGGKLPGQSYWFYDIRERRHRTCRPAATTDSVMNGDGAVSPSVRAGKEKESFKRHTAVRQACQVSPEVPSRVIECAHVE